VTEVNARYLPRLCVPLHQT